MIKVVGFGICVELDPNFAKGKFAAVRLHLGPGTATRNTPPEFSAASLFSCQVWGLRRRLKTMEWAEPRWPELIGIIRSINHAAMVLRQ